MENQLGGSNFGGMIPDSMELYHKNQNKKNIQVTCVSSSCPDDFHMTECLCMIPAWDCDITGSWGMATFSGRSVHCTAHWFTPLNSSFCCYSHGDYNTTCILLQPIATVIQFHAQMFSHLAGGIGCPSLHPNQLPSTALLSGITECSRLNVHVRGRILLESRCNRR